MNDQDFDISEEVLNLSTNRWIKKNGKLYKRLLRDSYKYVEDLSYYLEDILPIDTDKYGTIHLLADFYYSALILPLSTLTVRRDLCRRYPISVGTVVEGGMSLFTKEKNGKTFLENLIRMNYSSLSALLEMRWEDNEIWEWRDNILTRFLHHPNLILSKYRPNALYDAFSKAGVLGPEHILVIAQTLR
ncbi:1349_t:CDS:1 [Diversispora eburnea]|uniref:1349_t:CDS:1 n=1 Tax=Diversispora eburnea TaxID=1213867 RepID=A0A9N9DQR6_9GLOM|nr:1349_t:CDS:1 [Diversispora eburnea]